MNGSTPSRGPDSASFHIARPPSGRAARLCALVALLVGATVASCRPAPEAPQEEIDRRLSLVSVAYDDETREADTRLAQYLESEVEGYLQEELQERKPFEISLDRHTYDSAVARLVEQADDSTYVARLTPYVYVVAEMLGAEFAVVGTYLSKATFQGDTDAIAEGETGFTYNSYLVVNGPEMAERMGRAPGSSSLLSIEEYLRSFTDQPPRFIYHSKFSTSSFFLPSVYFRERGIIDMSSPPQKGSPVIQIRTEDIGKGETISSKRLVRQVAAGEAQLAAVWDGTKAHFERQFEEGEPDGEVADKVAFVALDQALPNDLLVVSSSMNPLVREGIRNAIEKMNEADIQNDADFKLWRPIDVEATRRARSALAGLRQLAREQISPVTVRIEVGESLDAEVSAELRSLRQAAEDAVRLSGSEFVLWSEFYAHSDFLWKLRPIHDGAAVLTSSIEGLTGWEQEFQISYKDFRDLTERVGDLIRSRLHRLRHVWPYSKSDAPTILRDVDFSVAEGESVEVQKVRWLNRETNDFVIERTFNAEVVEADSRRFVLSGERFDESLNPVGSVSYRAVLPRPSEERPLFTILTAILLLLFLAATIAAVLELRRSSSLPAAAPAEVIDGAFRGVVENYHQMWRTGAADALAEADILGQDRDAIEVYISELKLAEGPWWRRLVQRLVSEKEKSEDDEHRGLTRELLVEREEIGGTTRLAGLIEYLAKKPKLSPFTGTSREFEAWNRAADELFSQGVKVSDQPDERQLLFREGAYLSRLVSTHFGGVLKGARRSVSLFRKTWRTGQDPEDRFHWILRSEERLPVALERGSLALGTDEPESDPISHLLIEFKLERPSTVTIIDGQDIDAWLLGILDRRPAVVRTDDGLSCLRLHFKPLAVLRDPEC